MKAKRLTEKDLKQYCNRCKGVKEDKHFSECRGCRKYRQLSKKHKSMRIEAMNLFGIKKEN
jgi:hypothetical protein